MTLAASCQPPPPDTHTFRMRTVKRHREPNTRQHPCRITYTLTPLDASLTTPLPPVSLQFYTNIS
eukprot:314764-Chlamydomonas_euryale.AAC.1